VMGITKGKGFQGVGKTFPRGRVPPPTARMFHRRIGSIGIAQTPGSHWKNQAMPVTNGFRHRTVQNLTVVKVIADKISSREGCGPRRHRRRPDRALRHQRPAQGGQLTPGTKSS